MLAGAARIDITPDYPTDLGGFFVRTQPAEGVADHIWVRVAVFDNGQARLVVVSLELLEIPRPMADSLRAELAELLNTRRKGFASPARTRMRPPRHTPCANAARSPTATSATCASASSSAPARPPRTWPPCDWRRPPAHCASA